MDIYSLSLAGVLLIILQIAVTANIILYKDDVKSSIGWIGLVWLSPLIGTVIYIIFGINRIKRKAETLRNSGPDTLDFIMAETALPLKEQAPNFIQLLMLGYKVHPQLFALKNKVTPLLNGDEAYPEMAKAIAAAKKEVLIASYIFDNDAAGAMILDAAKQAALNGAKIRVMVDGIGINYSKPTIKSAAEQIEGLEFAVFLPSKKPVTLPFVNLRNHRKIMVIDGHTAFFGGMNISADDILKTKPKHPVADITFKVEGPVTQQMAAVFLSDWLFCRGKNFAPVTYEAQPNNDGQSPCRIIPDGPDSDRGKIQMLISGALSCAQKKIQIVTPYFLPESETLSDLITAAMRGVEVEIILPNRSNIFGMDWAMQSNFEMLINKGIKIYRTPAPFDHSKIFVIDGYWSLVGSANWDVRSFKLNFECNMECLSRELASKLEKIIEDKKAKAQLVTAAPKNKLIQLRNNTMRLLTPYY